MGHDGAILIAHLSDLHLRDANDVAALDRQLARIASRSPSHLAVTGDLLDRWDRALLAQALEAFARHGFRDADRLTIIHGNHDLSSSGGHPRARRDLVRLALRFWDPPPLIAWRHRAFYADINDWCEGVARAAPFAKAPSAGVKIAVVDSVPTPWLPVRVDGRLLTVSHAVGCVRRGDAEWLAHQRGIEPVVVLIHHYPLDVAAFSWRPLGRLGRLIERVDVPMAIPEKDRVTFWRAAEDASARLVLCGHVHRARLEWHQGIAVGLNGQSGADWAGRTIAFYWITPEQVTATLEGDTDQKRYA